MEGVVVENYEWLDKLTDKRFLQENLTFASIFIAVYEHMVDYVVSEIQNFYCDYEIKEQKLVYVKSDGYKRKIINRVVDEKGNKDKIKSSFLWLVDNGVITDVEYRKFLLMKDIRNKYAHELTRVIYEGVNEEEFALLLDMHVLYSIISKWFFIEIEAPMLDYHIPENANVEIMQNTASYAFGIVIDTLYSDKSEDYKSRVTSIRKGNKYEI